MNITFVPVNILTNTVSYVMHILFKLNRLWAQLTLELIKMSDSPDRKRDYVKFNGINFPQWRYAVMLKLRKKKLEDVVLGIEKKPTEVTRHSIFVQKQTEC